MDSVNVATQRHQGFLGVHGHQCDDTCRRMASLLAGRPGMTPGEAWAAFAALEAEAQDVDSVDLPRLRHRRNLMAARQTVANVATEVGDPHLVEDAENYGARWEAIMGALRAAVEHAEAVVQALALLAELMARPSSAATTDTDSADLATPRAGAPPGGARTVRRHQASLTGRRSSSRGVGGHAHPHPLAPHMLATWPEDHPA